jgi:hypothetical protein
MAALFGCRNVSYQLIVVIVDGSDNGSVCALSEDNMGYTQEVAVNRER